jgi:ribonuclease HI
VITILRCTELLLSKNETRRSIHICCDSRAAIAALTKNTTESVWVWKCMQALEKLSVSNEVTLVWIQEHQGIPRNEEADKLVKLLALICCGERSHKESFKAGVPVQVEGL